jgi:hypothetical protein
MAEAADCRVQSQFGGRVTRVGAVQGGQPGGAP